MNDHGSRVLMLMISLVVAWSLFAPLIAHLMGWI
jgi:hypothetical protein